MVQKNHFGLDGLKPTGFDKHGAYWSVKDISHAVFKMADTDKTTFMKERLKKMNENYKEATETIDQTKEIFRASVSALVKTEQELAEQSKKVSGSVRKSANELMNGLEKLQKTANFTAFERQVELLERASVALQALAELEKSGKLEKLISAIK